MKLKLLVGDSKRQAKQAEAEALRLGIKHGCIGFIGAASSGPTIDASNLLSAPLLDRAIISYSATSSRLSEPSFTNFARTPLSDVAQSKVIATLMKGQFAGYFVLVELALSFSWRFCCLFGTVVSKTTALPPSPILIIMTHLCYCCMQCVFNQITSNGNAPTS